MLYLPQDTYFLVILYHGCFRTIKSLISIHYVSTLFIAFGPRFVPKELTRSRGFVLSHVVRVRYTCVSTRSTCFSSFRVWIFYSPLGVHVTSQTLGRQRELITFLQVGLVKSGKYLPTGNHCKIIIPICIKALIPIMLAQSTRISIIPCT